jgi:predicted metal-dependent phosphoesterase TrpH
MSPRAIVEKGKEKRLDIIALCDHNSAENVGAAIRAGVQHGLHVFPGMEINSSEEVHTLAIFDSEEQALAMQEVVYKYLKGTNRPELFGDQVIANEFDEVEGFNDRMLIGATQLALNDIINEVHRLGGLSIASHVDRPSFSILSQLGFIPPDLAVDALEISRHMDWAEARKKIPGVDDFPLVASSDAHFIEDIGGCYTSFFLAFPTVNEIRMALRGKSGRSVED